MLVLTRKHQETLHIGNDIVITIVRVRGDSVRIGIQAPTEIQVMRSELLGLAPKPAAVPEPNRTTSKSVPPHLNASSPPKPMANDGKECPTGPGPLTKFLKALPKIDMAIAS